MIIVLQILQINIHQSLHIKGQLIMKSQAVSQFIDRSSGSLDSALPSSWDVGFEETIKLQFTCSVSMASFGPPQKTIQAKGKGSAGSRGQPKSGGQVRSPSGTKSAPGPRLSDRLNPKTIDPVRCLFLLSNR